MDKQNDIQDQEKKYMYPQFTTPNNFMFNENYIERQIDIPVGIPVSQPQPQQLRQTQQPYQQPNQAFQYPQIYNGVQSPFTQQQQNYPYPQNNLLQPAPFQVIQVFPQGGDLSQPYSQSYFCGTCRNLIQTRIKLTIGYGQFLCALIICILGGFFGCCLIPFCFDSCKDITHTCPQCGNPLGRTPFLGRKRFY